MTNEEFAVLMQKYQNGQCTSEEAEALDQWYDSYQENPDVLSGLSLKDRQLLEHRIFSQIEDKIANGPATVEPALKNGSMRQLWVKLTAAAAVLICVAVGFWLSRMPYKPVSSVTEILVINNPGNQILKQTLPDGSSVWLKPGASIRYPKVFAADSRKVTMQGMIFFEITKNPKRPFIIQSRHLLTKVWGTSFQVTDGEQLTKAMVTVLTGKVSVQAISSPHQAGSGIAPAEVMLLPKQQVIFNDKQHSLVTEKKADLHDMKIWTHQNLNFNNDQFVHIVEVLNERFGVTIQIADPTLRNASMTADFNDLNLPDVLDVLKASMQVRYEITGDKINLTKTQL